MVSRFFIVLNAALLCMFVLLTANETASAALPTAQLHAIYPPGASAGTVVHVEIDGANLEDVDRLVFSHPGLVAKHVPAEKATSDIAPKPISGKFVVTASADVPPGCYDVRAIGRFGVSNPRVFEVSQRQELVEENEAQGKTNHSTDKALPIKLGTIVNGRIADDQIDYFRFRATAGEKLRIVCAARCLDSPLDAELTLYNTQGKQLQRVRDAHSCNPVLTFAVPNDGEYVLGVTDFVNRGGKEYVYRLTLDRRPYVEAVFPSIGRAGEMTEFTLYGRHLPGGEAVGSTGLQKTKVFVRLPADEKRTTGLPSSVFAAAPSTMLDGHAFRLSSAHGLANPITIGYASAPVVVENESNNEPSIAQKVSLPCEYAGQLAKQGDRDWITFDAKAGQTVWLDVISHRAGRDTDPVLKIEKVTTVDGKEQTKTITELDEGETFLKKQPLYDPRSKDPWYKLTVEEDVTYRVRVTDRYNRGDPRMTYRLVLGLRKPDFRMVAHLAPYRQEKTEAHFDSLVLRSGAKAAFRVHVFRQFGSDEPIRITAEGLPEGVTCHEAINSGGAPWSELVFSANEKCKAASAPIRIVGRAMIDGKEVVREARGATLIYSSKSTEQDPPFSRLARSTWVSVVDDQDGPVSIKIQGDGQLATCYGGKIDLPFDIIRRDNHKEGVWIVPVGFSPLLPVTNKSMKGDSGKFQLHLNRTNIPPGTYTIYMHGFGKFNYARHPEALKRLQAAEKEVEQSLKNLESNAAAFGVDLGKEKDAVTADLRLRFEEKLKQARQAIKREKIRFNAVSEPITLRVDPSPVSLSGFDASMSTKPGTSIDIPVAIERKYGFDGPVTVKYQPTGGEKLTVQTLTIEKGKTEGKLTLPISKDQKPGDYLGKLTTQVRFGGFDLKTQDRVEVTVAPLSDKSEKKVAAQP